MKILNIKTKNFDKNLDYLLLKRRKSIKSDKISVTNIINDVKKNGDKALIKYEKKFNRNNTIIPSNTKITKLIKSLNPKVKKAIDKNNFKTKFASEVLDREKWFKAKHGKCLWHERPDWEQTYEKAC